MIWFPGLECEKKNYKFVTHFYYYLNENTKALSWCWKWSYYFSWYKVNHLMGRTPRKCMQSKRLNGFSTCLIYCIKEKLMQKCIIFTCLELREKDNSECICQNYFIPLIICFTTYATICKKKTLSMLWASKCPKT